MVVINGMKKSSLIDYPGRIVSTIFFGKCNFRCPYCHNSGLVLGRELPEIEEQVLLDHLEQRRGKLDGICITGGEPTLRADLPEIIRHVKERGFLVKLDSNGTNPAMLEELLSEKLVDYIAMDIKAPREKYSSVVKVEPNMAHIQKSMDLIMELAPDYEFRTTVVKELLSPEDIAEIGRWISGARRYVLQQFRPGNTLDPECERCHAYAGEEIKEMARDLEKYVKEVLIRGA